METRGFLAVCPRACRDTEVLEDGTGRPGGGGTMTAGLLRASGGMACPELHSHQAGADVFVSGSPHPQPEEP